LRQYSLYVLSIMTDTPRVFESGAITQVIGARGITLYVEHLELEYVHKVKTETCPETGRSSVHIWFQQSFDKEISRKIEENIRIAKMLPWITIARARPEN
jgi:hypothetical protein